MRCFLDFKPGGNLCHIFANMYRYKMEQKWKKFDFIMAKHPMRKDPTNQMLMEIETALIEAECFRLPVVYVRPDVEKSLAVRIRSIITKHQGEITEDEEEASHIVCPIVEPLPEDFARPIFKKGNHIMIHWYYFPESYDSWVPNTFDLPVSYNLLPTYVFTKVSCVKWVFSCLRFCRTIFQKIRDRQKIDGVYLHHGF